jgi:hypothetical protein
MAGLIDGLDIYYPAGVDYFDATSEWYSRDDLRVLLRSDKAREALAEAIREALGTAILWREMPAPLVTDAVVRVLTGEEGDRG